MAKEKINTIVSSLEGIKVALKKLIQEAMINGTSREDLEKGAKAFIENYLKEHEDLKKSYNEVYQMFKRLLYGNFLTMYKIATKTLNKELLNDKISKEVQVDLKKAYESDKVKKESYVFFSGDNIEVSKIDATETPNLKYIRTNAEYGYTQMQIDNYVEKVERVMDKISQVTFLAVNSSGARVSLRNKAEMEVRYQDMLEDLKGLKDEKFVIVSQHKDSSLRCACWQGLIYLKDTDGTDVSLLNWHEWNTIHNHIEPKPIGYTKDNQPYYSLRDAMEHGLFSYNCRHRFIKYEPGVKVPKQLPYNPDEESKHSKVDQKMRQMEQNIRRAKERQTLALTPKERKKWQTRSRKLQADYSDFCKANNRVRNEWRTSIGVVERGINKAIHRHFENDDSIPLKDELKSQNIDGKIKLDHKGLMCKHKEIEVEPLDFKEFSKLKNDFEEQGGLFIQDADAQQYLKFRNADALTLNENTILLKPEPTASEIHEELIHAEQFKNGKLSDITNGKVKLECEIEACKILIEKQLEFKITDKEHKYNQERLEIMLKDWKDENYDKY